MRLNTVTDLRQFLDHGLYAFRWFVENTESYPLGHKITFTCQNSGHSNSICKTDTGYQFVADSDVCLDLRAVVAEDVMQQFWRELKK